MSRRYKNAVGLQYNPHQHSVPSVSIKGAAFEADEIVKIAERFGIPVIERPELTKALASLQEGEGIPEDLYEAVAIILAEIERLYC